jgi:translation initiation factor IF-2
LRAWAKKPLKKYLLLPRSLFYNIKIPQHGGVLKISDLAKKVKIPAKVLLIQIVKLGITAKSTQAILPEDAVDKILKAVAKSKPSIDIDKIKKAKPSGAKKTAPKKTKGLKPSKAGSAARDKKSSAGDKISEPKPKPGKSGKKISRIKTKSGKSEKPTEPLSEGPSEVMPDDSLNVLTKDKAFAEGKDIRGLVKGAELRESRESNAKEESAAQDQGLKHLFLKIPISVKDMAEKISIAPKLVIKELMGMNVFASINQLIGETDVHAVGKIFGYNIERQPTIEEEVAASHDGQEQDTASLKPRPPVVTFMGHVDHGKTSLLDCIRKSKVTDTETGGITQHIGAYEVILDKGRISFLDTPGHAAFTAMRARGANATDIVVLVVAADDGIMPQTIEAIDHAKAAGVTIIVAINKVDKPDADIDRVKKQLSETGLLPEDWGGKTITVNVSAVTGQGIDNLLDMILLEAEMLELKANPDKPAKGVVVEAKISKGGGPIATILVQNGTLRQGDLVIAGQYCGKVRAMLDDKIHRVKDAPPSKPVEILGLNGIPQAGDTFMVVSDEKKAKQICAMRQEKIKEQTTSVVQRITLEDLYSQIQTGKVKELKVILKADVRGSLEAIADSLAGLGTKNMGLNIIHKGVGDINDSDILLAAASNAIVIGFHVRKTPEAEHAGKLEHVDIRLYNIIYEAISDIKAAMEGLLEPDIKEVFRARILVKQVLKLSKAGIIAGSIVQKGKVLRNSNCRVIRENEIVYKGKVGSLKRFKEDVKEVAEGFECGVKLENFNSIRNGDVIECYEIEKIARRL